MSTEGFARGPRTPAPHVPGGEIELQAPPEVPRPVAGGLLAKLMPVVMVVAMVGMVALMVASGGMRNPMTLLFPLMMVFSMVGMAANSAGGKSKSSAELDEERKDYFRYLSGLRADVAATAGAQRSALRRDHPCPHTLPGLAGGPRMWERTPGHDDFLHVRIGTADQRLATALATPPLGAPEDLEPICAVAMRRFVHTHSVVRGLPTAVSLGAFASIGIGGDRAAARGAVRAMLLQLCTFHGPDHVRVAVVTPEPDGDDWGWIKWLPHARPAGARAAGAGSSVFGSLHALEEGLAAELEGRGRFSGPAGADPDRPRLVLVLDGGHVAGDERIVAAGGIAGVSVLDLTGGFEQLSARSGMRCAVRDGRIRGLTSVGEEDLGDADAVGAAEAAATARGLARYRPVAPSGESGGARRGAGLMTLLGIADVFSLRPESAWRRRTGRDRLRVPIGVDRSGAPVEIDLKEAAEGGMGPHGLCIGSTGSGKSELLRTLVLSLIATHSPEQLNLVLVDFKGGATFLGMERCDHTAAVITNLEDEIALVDRMRDALAGEMRRRQELLRAAGNYANVGEYENARAAGAPLAPLPALFIVVDEFSELLSAKPEFAELFAAIGRLGRSLHVHLLLASQRLDEGRLRGLDSHLSYRIGLKTFSGGESRSVLGVPDAYHLPAAPGSGYLKCDSGELVRFRASYVSGPAPRRPRAEAARASAGWAWAMPLTAAARTPPAVVLAERSAGRMRGGGHGAYGGGGSDEAGGAGGDAAPDAAGPSLLETVVERLGACGHRAHEVWLPPLDRSPTLGELLPAVPPGAPVPPDAEGEAGDTDVGHGGRGRTGDGSRAGDGGRGGGLTAAIGLVDRPFDQRRDTLTVRLAGAGGNAAIVGGPQSGKSTAACTLVLALAARNPPEDVQVYALDFGGGRLTALADLPHVGTVASRMAPDRVRRTIAELTALVEHREELFARLGIESMERYRALRREGAADAADGAGAVGAAGAAEGFGPGTYHDRFGDAFLVIDGFGAIRENFAELEPPIQELATRGLSYGVHVVLTAGRWAQIRPALKDMIGTRIELRLGDPADSHMHRKRAAQVPEGRPGRGLTADGLHMLLALPTLDPAGALEVSGSLEADGAAGAAGPAGTDGVDAPGAAVRALRERYAGRAPEVRMLPSRVGLDELREAAGAPGGGARGGSAAGARPRLDVPIGIDEAALAPVYAELSTQPHFIVFADPESGKTTALRTLCRGILAANTPQQAKLIVADYRRTLLGEVTGDHLAGYATTSETLSGMVSEACRILAGRLPGPDVTQEQLRARAWWSGPEIVFVVDDYDLVATASGNPLSPLADYLPQAKDIGFHLVLARRTGGAARALFDPVLGRLRELSTDGIVMNGSREEGPVIGAVRPQAMPPGRGTLVSRSGGSRLVQVAACEPRP